MHVHYLYIMYLINSVPFLPSCCLFAHSKPHILLSAAKNYRILQNAQEISSTAAKLGYQ